MRTVRFAKLLSSYLPRRSYQQLVVTAIIILVLVLLIAIIIWEKTRRESPSRTLSPCLWGNPPFFLLYLFPPRFIGFCMYTPFLRRWRPVRPPRRFEWTLLCCASKSVPFLSGLCQVMACLAPSRPIPESPISSLAPTYRHTTKHAEVQHLHCRLPSCIPSSIYTAFRPLVYSGV